jgi:hypothetical protein
VTLEVEIIVPWSATDAGSDKGIAHRNTDLGAPPANRRAVLRAITKARQPIDIIEEWVNSWGGIGDASG